MLNNNTALLNMNMNNIDIFIDPHKSNGSIYNGMNLSLNLQKIEKNTNIQNKIIQFPWKEESQNINLMRNINPKRNRQAIGEIDEVNENSEWEIKSIRDKIRKKYQSSSIERNSHNYSQNNTALSLEKATMEESKHIKQLSIIIII